MTILVTFSEADFEIIAGPPSPGEEKKQVSMFIDFVEEAMQFCMVESDIQSTGCSLRYLSVDTHPFKDLGDLYQLAYINLDTLLELPENPKDRIKIQLPVIEEGVGRISEVARILGIPSTDPEEALLGCFRIRLAHKQLENTLDFNSIKTVIRGTEDQLEHLKKRGLHPSNMGGIIDTPATVAINDVWGLDDQPPKPMPKFFVFE